MNVNAVTHPKSNQRGDKWGDFTAKTHLNTGKAGRRKQNRNKSPLPSLCCCEQGGTDLLTIKPSQRVSGENQPCPLLNKLHSQGLHCSKDTMRARPSCTWGGSGLCTDGNYPTPLSLEILASFKLKSSGRRNVAELTHDRLPLTARL